MTPFRDDDAGPLEPVRGLPEPLPNGESVLWQGSPSAFTFAIHAFHVRFVALWFVGMTAWRVSAGVANGETLVQQTGLIANALGLGSAAIALLFVLAWAIARTAVFTITQKRVVLRFGVAIRKYVNLPLSRIASADVRRVRGKRGDIALSVTGPGSIGYIYLWPFARPLKFAPVQPLLRALPDVDAPSRVLADAAKAELPDAQVAERAQVVRPPKAPPSLAGEPQPV